MSLLVFIRQISLKDIIKFVLITSLCAFVTALTLTYFYKENWGYFWLRLPEYIFVYTSFSLSMMLTYAWQKVALNAKFTAGAIFGLAVSSYSITFVLCVIVFQWFSFKQLGEGALYLLNFMTSSAWVLLLMFYFNSKVVEPRLREMNKILADTQLEKDLAESQLQLLQAQLEPHFFFNTLANLHNLIEDSPDKAMFLLEELSQYLRLCLPQFRNSTQLLKEEMAIVNTYLSIQNIRFDHKLEIISEINDSLLDAEILPMSILTLVENAIKHGLAQQSHGKIKIHCQQDNTFLVIRVTDSAGKKVSGIPGIGLTNLETRLRLRYGEIATIKLNQLEHQYTEAEMRVPYHAKSSHC
ncbi:sensor histidine kinase [Alishewanella sp. d11]|uniref:sensor histidine kinase n=1 Tax=Alishewanella sp. d11 TaxID=3414030 RepID=UPI003BF7AC5F